MRGFADRLKLRSNSMFKGTLPVEHEEPHEQQLTVVLRKISQIRTGRPRSILGEYSLPIFTEGYIELGDLGSEKLDSRSQFRDRRSEEFDSRSQFRQASQFG